MSKEKLTVETYLYETFRAEDSYEAYVKIIKDFLEQIRDEIVELETTDEDGYDIIFTDRVNEVFDKYINEK